MKILQDILEAVEKGRMKSVSALVHDAILDGLPAEDILNKGLIAGMDKIGEGFKQNKVFIPEVMLAAKTMNLGMEELKPLLLSQNVKPAGRACIGTVKGDRHDIGKNLVKMMMESKGIEVVDLGTDVPCEAFLNAALEKGCSVIALSALLTTTMPSMKAVIELFKSSGIRDKVFIMIGGAPVSEDFCKLIGADAYSPDAAAAAETAFNYLNRE